MSWLFLVIAGCFEVLGVIGMKWAALRKGWKAYILLGFSGLSSFSFLSLAMRGLPMGTAYAVWTGIGTVGGALLGMFLYNEPKEWRRVLFIVMILGSAVGLKLIS
ncbi:multidrug efflux SMR transporter [Paenibacillus sediminis]|uniref:Paired small multidrug resistance pump n=1 Tax=Paenibacillus sediminis TaxID=664909 RepID=A0ABS4H2N2_9BACL|nr:multidrug efflux SMR transporter [Paenibacillus sediminis]MBP1936731.1 paired small multidrug resistance pump [Paenibacillus sediminis]